MSGRRISAGSAHALHPEGDPILSPAEAVAAAGGESKVVVSDLVEPMEAPQSQEPPATTLTDEERSLFTSLLTCGKRRRTVDVMGHQVTVQSLSADDDLRIGLFAKDYLGSAAEQRAYQIGVAAAGLVAINGVPLYQSLTAEVDLGEEFETKVAKVRTMTPLVMAQVYRQVLNMESEFVELATRLGKLSG